MPNELKIDYCPRCGRVYQKNLRNLCSACSAKEESALRAAELIMLRNRHLSTEEVAAAAAVPPEKIRSWIRTGKFALSDYPNLTDHCDSCRAPIRKGHICHDCAKRIKSDIAHALEQERLMKERLRAASSYISRN